MILFLWENDDAPEREPKEMLIDHLKACNPGEELGGVGGINPLPEGSVLASASVRVRVSWHTKEHDQVPWNRTFTSGPWYRAPTSTGVGGCGKLTVAYG